MALTLKEQNSGRQYPLIAVVELGFADLPAGEATEIFELPHGAVVIGGDFVVTQVGDGAVSETMDIGDTASGDRYADGVNAKALARTALTITGFKTSGKTAITATRIEGGAAAMQGTYRFTVLYMQTDRSNENQG